MNIKLLVLFLFAAVPTGHLHSYSWSIKNGTDKDLYIRLSTNFTNPIGTSKGGVLVKPDAVSDSAGKSEKLPRKFKNLTIADDESMTKNAVSFSLDDDHNINYTITINIREEPETLITTYKLTSNNPKDLPQARFMEIKQPMNQQEIENQKDRKAAKKSREDAQYALFLQKITQLQQAQQKLMEELLIAVVRKPDFEKTKQVLQQLFNPAQSLRKKGTYSDIINGLNLISTIAQLKQSNTEEDQITKDKRERIIQLIEQKKEQGFNTP